MASKWTLYIPEVRQDDVRHQLNALSDKCGGRTTHYRDGEWFNRVTREEVCEVVAVVTLVTDKDIRSEVEALAAKLKQLGEESVLVTVETVEALWL